MSMPAEVTGPTVVIGCLSALRPIRAYPSILLSLSLFSLSLSLALSRSLSRSIFFALSPLSLSLALSRLSRSLNLSPSSLSLSLLSLSPSLSPSLGLLSYSLPLSLPLSPLPLSLPSSLPLSRLSLALSRSLSLSLALSRSLSLSPLSLSPLPLPDTQGLHQRPIELVNLKWLCWSVISEKGRKGNLCGERENKTGRILGQLRSHRMQLLFVFPSHLSLFILSLIDFIVLFFALRFPCPFSLLIVVVNCPWMHPSSFLLSQSLSDGEFVLAQDVLLQ